MLTKQIVDTLHTLNENIVNLGDSLMKANFGGEMMQKTKMDTGQEEFSQKEASDQVNQVDAQNKNKEGGDNQKDNKATETLQNLYKDNQKFFLLFLFLNVQVAKFCLLALGLFLVFYFSQQYHVSWTFLILYL